MKRRTSLTLRLWCTIAAATVTTVLVACGGELLDAGATATDAQLADAALPPRVESTAVISREEATALCQEDQDASQTLLVRCSAIPTGVVPESIVRQCVETLLAPGITASTIATYRACIGSLSTLPCVGGLKNCLVGLSGSLPNGERCASDAQCASGLCLGTQLYGPRCGTCAPPLAPGSTCHEGDPCAPGTRCDVGPCLVDDCQTGTCKPVATTPPSADAGCNPQNCGIDSKCTDAGACVPSAREGQPCNEDRDCLGTLFCDLGQHRCAHRPRVGPGEPCGDPNPKDCEGWLWHCPQLDDGTQRCHVWLDEGDPCDVNASYGSLERCTFGLRCVEGHCRLDWPTCP